MARLKTLQSKLFGLALGGLGNQNQLIPPFMFDDQLFWVGMAQNALQWQLDWLHIQMGITIMGLTKNLHTACTIYKHSFSALFTIFYMQTNFDVGLHHKCNRILLHLQTTIFKWELPKWGLQSTLGYDSTKRNFQSWLVMLVTTLKVRFKTI